MKQKVGKKLFWPFVLAQIYTLAIFVSLYFTPFLRDFLAERYLLGQFVSGIYVLFSLFALTLFLYKYRIRSWRAYLSFLFILGLFLFQFLNTPRWIERIHLLEYGIFYILWFRVFRHFLRGVLLYGITLWFTGLVGFSEELIQHLLPNRYFDWNDIYLNLYGTLLGILATSIFTRYRRDYRQPQIG